MTSFIKHKAAKAFDIKGIIYIYHYYYSVFTTPNQKKVGAVWKAHIKKESSDL